MYEKLNLSLDLQKFSGSVCICSPINSDEFEPETLLYDPEIMMILHNRVCVTSCSDIYSPTVNTESLCF